MLRSERIIKSIRCRPSDDRVPTPDGGSLQRFIADLYIGATVCATFHNTTEEERDIFYSNMRRDIIEAVYGDFTEALPALAARVQSMAERLAALGEGNAVDFRTAQLIKELIPDGT